MELFTRNSDEVYSELCVFTDIPKLEICEEKPKIPPYIRDLSFLDPTSAEMALEGTIDGDILAMLTGDSKAENKTFTVHFENPVRVQIRRHKKKRINKKWAKRFGYKTVFKHHVIVDCTIDPMFATADAEIDILVHGKWWR